jgi:hypothetical protein
MEHKNFHKEDESQNIEFHFQLIAFEAKNWPFELILDVHN